MYRKSVTADARIERLMLKIEFEAKFFSVICDRSVKIIDEKLRRYPSNCHQLPQGLKPTLVLKHLCCRPEGLLHPASTETDFSARRARWRGVPPGGA